MSRRSPFVVVLSNTDRVVLEASVGGYTGPFWLVQRARIVLLSADVPNVDIARRLGVDVDTVSKWRKRFVTEGLAGLKNRPRSGRPRHFAGEVVAGVKAMACQRQAALSPVAAPGTQRLDRLYPRSRTPAHHARRLSRNRRMVPRPRPVSGASGHRPASDRSATILVSAAPENWMTPELIGKAQRMYASKQFTMAEIAASCGGVTPMTIYRNITTTPAAATTWEATPAACPRLAARRPPTENPGLVCKGRW